MKKRSLIAVLVILAVVIGTIAAMWLSSYSSDPCDGYGDCVSSSISYTRANPDNSLYLGDQFTISLSLTPGSGGYPGASWSGQLTGVTWSYDQGAFRANESASSVAFIAITNETGSYTVAATASFLVTITTCTTDSNGKTTCTTSYVTTSIPLSLQVSLRAFVLSFQTQLVNATTPLHQTRRNLDGSFYPFDAFYLNYSYSFQFIQQRSDIKTYVIPTFDHVILNLTKYSNSTSTGYFFFQMDNKTGYFQVTTKATAYNWLKQVLGTRQTTTPSRIIPLIIDFPTKMLNVTASNPLVTGGKMLLRNPDGSFFRNDSFAIGWNATFKFSDFRKDIRVNVTSINPPYLKTIGLASDKLGRNGMFTYLIGANAMYQPYSLTPKAEAFNYYNYSLALTTSKQPYAVVKYHPFFTYFTYMLYNSKNSSTYQRDFVTLVRYGGNDPGYSYKGDINTAPLVAGNDTGERAWVNNFTFANTAWRVQFSQVSSSITDDLTFTNLGSANVTIRPVNSTFNIITWSDRVQKYYFLGKGFENYTAKGTVYFNVTEHAFSRDYAGGMYPLFNTTYLYQPMDYNGYLVFKAYDSAGKPDPSVNMTVTVHNPYPLNRYLISRVQHVFGNDSVVVAAFKHDLYPAYNTTQVLKPLSVSNGVRTYLINQTNIGFLSAPLPYFTVTAAGHGRTFTYSFNDSFSAFLLANTTLPTLPFQNVTAYYVDHQRHLISLPTNYSSLGRNQFLYWEYNSAVGFISPVTDEPGGLSKLYPFLYGQISTIPVNLDGGGVVFFGAQTLSLGSYLVDVGFTPSSGGALKLWVIDSAGHLLASENLQPNAAPFQPSAYYGVTSIVVPVQGNGTVTVQAENSWGLNYAVGSFQGEVQPYRLPPPDYYLTFFLVIVMVVGALSILVKRRAGKKEEEE